LPPGTPKDRVQILEGAFRRIVKDPEFPPYFKKLVSDDASPLGPEELRKIIAEIPRDAEVVDELKKLSGAGPLPAR
jgi:tripartite-type tricarboxylate transporter receptor subunit TctC